MYCIVLYCAVSIQNVQQHRSCAPENLFVVVVVVVAMHGVYLCLYLFSLFSFFFWIFLLASFTRSLACSLQKQIFTSFIYRVIITVYYIWVVRFSFVCWLVRSFLSVCIGSFWNRNGLTYVKCCAYHRAYRYFVCFVEWNERKKKHTEACTQCMMYANCYKTGNQTKPNQTNRWWMCG